MIFVRGASVNDYYKTYFKYKTFAMHGPIKVDHDYLTGTPSLPIEKYN